MAGNSSTRRSNNSPFKFSSKTIIQIAVVGFLGYTYLAVRPPAPKISGSPGGPPVTSPRVKLSDGRHLAYKELGVSNEEAKHKIIVSQGFDSSKDFILRVSEELIKEYKMYIVSFDRAGYGESDPNPARSVKSDAFDIQELADNLNLGSTFYLIGLSMGSYPVYSFLKYLPHRLSGVALVSPGLNYWWKCFPPELSNKAWDDLLFQDSLTYTIAHYTPWLFNAWMTQKLVPTFSILQGKEDCFSRSDLEIRKLLPLIPKEEMHKVRQQGVHESLYRDMMVIYGDWGFEPTDIGDPFPSKVHMWLGNEDRVVAFELNRALSRKLPWIEYHEVPGRGHLLIENATICETIFKALVSS